jgi:hypothetical protein
MVDESHSPDKSAQEEAELTNLSKRFIRQLGIVVKNFRMFGDTHPFLKDNVAKTSELLRGIFHFRDSVTFTFTEVSCLIEEIQLPDLDPKSYSFLGIAKECGITSLTFVKGMSDDELRTFLKILSDNIKSEKGLGYVLQQKGLSHIKADEVFFKKVTKKEEEALKARKHLEDFLIVNYFMGKAAISKDDIASLVGEMSVNPERMGKLISDAAKHAPEQGRAGGAPSFPGGAGTAPGGPSGTPVGGSQVPGGIGGTPAGDGQVPGGVEFAKNVIEKLAVHMKNVEGESYDGSKKRIGDLIMALEPTLRSEVLRSSIKAPEESGNLVEDVVRGLSDEIIADVIVSEVIERRSSVVQTRKLIERLLPTDEKRRRTFPFLEVRLLKKGVSQEVCMQLIDEKFWSDMSCDEKTRKIMEEAPSFCVEIGISDEIEMLVEDLLAEKKFDAACCVIDKVLENFQTADPALATRLIRDFEKLCLAALQSTDYPHKDKLIAQIRQEHQRLKEEAPRQRFARLFAEAIKICAANRWYVHLVPLLGAVGYDAVKPAISQDIKLDELFKDMLFGAECDRRIPQEVAQAVGDDAAIALREVLLTIVSDDFESYKKRYAIMAILKTLGGKAEEIFLRDLSSEKAEVLKNSLDTLSEIGTKNALPPIEKLLAHESPAIQKSAGIALKRIKQRAS